MNDQIWVKNQTNLIWNGGSIYECSLCKVSIYVVFTFPCLGLWLILDGMILSSPSLNERWVFCMEFFCRCLSRADWWRRRGTNSTSSALGGTWTENTVSTAHASRDHTGRRLPWHVFWQAARVKHYCMQVVVFAVGFALAENLIPWLLSSKPLWSLIRRW